MSQLFNDIKRAFEKRIASLAGIEVIAIDASEDEKKIYEQKIVKQISHRGMWCVLILLPFFLMTLWLGTKIASSPPVENGHKNYAKKEASGGKKIKFWTCSMHPQIKLPNSSSKCPICFMDLVAVYEGGGDEGSPNSLSLSENARKLIEVKTEPTVFRRLTHTLHMVGKVAYDETMLANISLWTPGRSRLNRMFVAFTGAWVQKGEPLVEVYSPDLIAAQGEYISAYMALGENKSGSMKQTLDDNRAAAHQKLLDLGMTKRQIKALEKNSKPEEKTLLYSPVTGTVIDKLVNEGEWHSRGMSIYKIADLSQVWIKLDAYESDMAWIRYAQEVHFEAEAFPGTIFKGRIAFIDPFLNEQTRTVKLRVNVANIEGKLRPGMFVRATINARVAEGGQVIDEVLADKWICPVHPGCISKKAGVCDISLGIDKSKKCNRKLVAAEKLNFTKDIELRSRVLSIPYTAPLLTGTRAVVYVEKRKNVYNDEGGIASTKISYHGVEIKLGPRVGKYYVVLSGLDEGQQVVVHGAYKIDSALQIMAKPSMMNPKIEIESEKNIEADKTPPYAMADASYHKKINKILKAYLTLTANLAEDKMQKAHKNLLQIKNETTTIVDFPDLPEIIKNKIQEHISFLQKALKNLTAEESRKVLGKVTLVITEYLKDFGHQLPHPLYKMFCPMAKGFWWQGEAKLKNPYFGTKMQSCGKNKLVLKTLKSKQMGRIAALSGRFWNSKSAHHKSFRILLKAYLRMGEIMAKDKTKDVIKLKRFKLKAIEKIDLKKQPKKMTKQLAFLKQMLIEMHGDNLKQLRRDYLDISNILIRFIKSFGHMHNNPLYIMHCSMYRHDMGGSWLQSYKKINNPYYGSQMLRCGDIEGFVPSMKNLNKKGN